MRPIRVRPIWGILGLCLLGVLLLRTALPHPATVPAVATPASRESLPPRGAFERALRTALQCRTRARLAVNQQLEALDAWDPTAADPTVAGSTSEEDWRLQWMAADRNGDLRRARGRARQAQRLARTSGQACEAAELLFLIEHEFGNHEEEFRQAQKLMALRPGQAGSFIALRRAASCTGRRQLEQWATRRLEAVKRAGQ